MIIWDTTHPYGKNNKLLDTFSCFQVELETANGEVLHFTFETGKILEFNQVTVIGGHLSGITSYSMVQQQKDEERGTCKLQMPIYSPTPFR
ncbi:hypothetical protein [Thermoflavimicrobium dichotomicum]|uniref:Uncharacterized protein n=1 Tax=Thermoflavimicrobium dichotomicum TaxID=46223 RepID=A0A1I3MMN6_9BACL|nr:hypothetical protein [Thermoflavimicrobium dichotomicum]SFI98257.1 hypothetical protein SAMN05421852_103130 [Thermoflavimicrobium dichotomicum]